LDLEDGNDSNNLLELAGDSFIVVDVLGGEADVLLVIPGENGGYITCKLNLEEFKLLELQYTIRFKLEVIKN
jgi:hypothetical protein